MTVVDRAGQLTDSSKGVQLAIAECSHGRGGQYSATVRPTPKPRLRGYG